MTIKIPAAELRISPDQYIDPGDIGSISDGYHTFDELYEHRMALMLALMKNCFKDSWRSKLHHPDDTPVFDGYFIVGMNLPTGQISYHYMLNYWDKFNGIPTLDHAPKWDGHTPADVVRRLVEAAVKL